MQEKKYKFLEHFERYETLDTAVGLWVDGKGIFHGAYGVDACNKFVEDTTAGAQESDDIETHNIRDVLASACVCVEDAFDMRHFMDAFLFAKKIYNQVKITPSNPYSYDDVKAIAAQAEEADRLIESVRWKFNLEERWPDFFEEVTRELNEHAAYLKKILATELTELSKEYGLAQVVSFAHSSKSRAVGFQSFNRTRVVVKWLKLVSAGVSPSMRRKRLRKYAGTIFLEGVDATNPVEHLRAVQGIRATTLMLDAFENTLAEQLAAEPELFLVTFMGLAPFEVSENVLREVAEKLFVIEQRHQANLAVVPVGVVHLFVNPDEDTLVPYPKDLKKQEIIRKLWEPNPDSLMFAPDVLVNTAEAVLLIS